MLTARTQGALEEVDDAIRTAGGQATLFPLDLMKDGEKLDMVGPSIAQRFGRLDILVHAAGVLSKLTPVAHIMPRDWQEAVAVNLTAAWRLIRTCDPPLRAATAGRAVFLTDGLVAQPRAYWGLYGFGKAGQEHLARSWAAEVANTAAAGQPVRPRRRRHQAARHGHARRGPGLDRPAGGCRAGDRRALPAGRDAQRRGHPARLN